MWKQCNNMKWVARGDEPTENYHLNLQLPELYSEFQPTSLLFRFTLTAPRAPFSAAAGRK